MMIWLESVMGLGDPAEGGRLPQGWVGGTVTPWVLAPWGSLVRRSFALVLNR